MVQLVLEARVNKNLFSNHYLDNLIQKNPEWKKKDHERAFQKIKDIYQEEKSFVEGLNEPQLEERFFQKIFQILLPDFEVQAPTEEEDFPDYAFFPNRQALDKAHESKGTRSFYVNAFAIGEVKKWSVELDRFGRDKYDKRRNPSFQIWLYLNETEPKWGILSNGQKWRLYHEDKPLDCYYEIDLVTLLETDDVEGFKYFYYFFRKEAFIPSEDGNVFIETVLRESLSYAKEIGENLKENVYKAMEKIAEGFFNWSQNELDPEDERIRIEVQKSTMRLLYRFLFLLYAEGKGLLNLKDEQYRTIYSFYRLKKEIKDKKEGPDQEYYSPAATTLWSRLKDLFRLIDQGSEVFDIPKDQFYVPPYNGGLFDPKRNPKLEELTIEDTYLADAVDLLARSGGEGDMKGFVDYSTLEIRHLGSIYEGLLEYKLKLAERDMVVKGGKKKRIWVTLEEFNKKRKLEKSFEDFDEFDRVRTGELYLATDRGERKATGSYYTPNYIVNYIVKNTINPVVEQKWKEASKKGQSLIDATLSVKVLDPAMGSGHFLVGAVELLAGKLLEAAKKDIEAGIVEDDRHFTPGWAKREVVANCIYGVDLNDLAVELAKLSLWLTTISKDKPLSFLDHRLKQGNSLIGTDLKDLPWHPLKKKDRKQRRMDIPEGFIKKLVDATREISSIDDDTLTNIIKKEEMFERFKTTKEYDMIKTLADVRTSIYFGNEIDETTYGRFTGNAYNSSQFEWNSMKDESFTRKAKEIAEERKFFHWELEFPEVFFEDGTLRENPGFDVVVGNPPYFSISTLPEEERKYLSNNFSEVFAGNSDILYYFLALIGSIIANGKYLGYIVGRYFQEAKYAAKLRKFLSSYSHLVNQVDFLNYQVFGANVNVLACISIFEKVPPKEDPMTYVLKITDDKASQEQVAVAILDSNNPLFERFEALSPYFSEKDWQFMPASLKKLEEKFERQSIPLGDIATVVKSMETGKNEVLAPSIEIIKQFKIEKELIHPVAKSGSIVRFHIEEDNRRIIWTEGIKFSDYPELKAYLTPYREDLSKRHDIKARKANWWEISNPRNADLFFSDYERILVPFMATGNKFCVDTEKHLNDGGDLRGIFFNKDSEISPYYVCAILNSKAGEKYHKTHSKLKRGGYYEYYEGKLSLFPIRHISFTTPEQERKAMVEKLKELYHKEVG